MTGIPPRTRSSITACPFEPTLTIVRKNQDNAGGKKNRAKYAEGYQCDIRPLLSLLVVVLHNGKLLLSGNDIPLNKFRQLV